MANYLDIQDVTRAIMQQIARYERNNNCCFHDRHEELQDAIFEAIDGRRLSTLHVISAQLDDLLEEQQ